MPLKNKRHIRPTFCEIFINEDTMKEERNFSIRRDTKREKKTFVSLVHDVNSSSSFYLTDSEVVRLRNKINEYIAEQRISEIDKA